MSCKPLFWGWMCVKSTVNQVILHGLESPLAYHSRTLSSAERHFSNTDKEALAIIVGVKKFHDYIHIYGRHVLIRPDHNPLLGILIGNKPMPEVLSPRMLRLTLKVLIINTIQNMCLENLLQMQML